MKRHTKKLVALLIVVIIAIGTFPAMANIPKTGVDVDGKWKMTEQGIDLLTLSVVPNVLRNVLIDNNNIWPKPEAEKEELSVPIGTVVSYQAGPSPMNMAGLVISKLFYVRTESGLDFYSEFDEVDENGECYGNTDEVFSYILGEESKDWPPTDDIKKTSFTFNEAGLYGVKAVITDNDENFPVAYYLVINVVGEAGEQIGNEPSNNTSDTDSTAINVLVNGKHVVFPDQQPTIINERTYIPVRFVAEELGADVDWEPEEQRIVILKYPTMLCMRIGSKSLEIADVSTVGENEIPTFTSIEMDVEPILVSERTMIPIRFVAENLGCTVEWDGNSQTVIIK